MTQVQDLVLRIQPLRPDDSIGKAAEAIRVSPASAVPVAENGRILGIVSARELKQVLAGGGADRLRTASVGTVMSHELLCLGGAVEVPEALEIFLDQGVEAAPVLDERGRYLGMVGTGELLSALCGRLRPPMIGGLATPLGVYLTSGVVRAGVGDTGLVLAGFFMGLLQFIAAWGAYHLTPPLARVAEAWQAHPWVAFAGATTRLPGLIAPTPVLYAWLPTVLTIVFFALLFRLSWITGYHAAEHQVVHAIEQGDELTLEAVRAKPRVHPRCGTNLMAAFVIFMVLHGGLPPELSWFAFPVALIAWRAFGSLLQQYVTTSPARDWQLLNGVRAGEELLERYQSRLAEQPSRWRRLWNIGLLQVLGGFFLLWCLLWLLETFSVLNTAWLDYLGR